MHWGILTNTLCAAAVLATVPTTDLRLAHQGSGGDRRRCVAGRTRGSSARKRQTTPGMKVASATGSVGFFFRSGSVCRCWLWVDLPTTSQWSAGTILEEIRLRRCPGGAATMAGSTMAKMAILVPCTHRKL